jgi:hypothetical protein
MNRMRESFDGKKREQKKRGKKFFWREFMSISIHATIVQMQNVSQNRASNLSM